jgi:hypothetical protein
VIILLNPPLIFVHIPKTAGTAISRALDPIDSSVQSQHLDRHATASEILGAFGANFWFRAKRFAVIRNPHHRLASAWLEMHKKPEMARAFDEQWPTFTDWIKYLPRHFDLPHESLPEIFTRYPGLHYHHTSQHDFIADKDVVLINRVLHFNNIEQEFLNLQRDWNIQAEPLEVVYPSDTENVAPYDEWYGTKTRAIVCKVYAKDFEL